MVPRLQVDQETSCNTSKDWSAISKDKYFEPTYQSYEKRQARGICQHAISAVGKNPLVCFSGSYILILQVWCGLTSAADLHQHAGHHNSPNFQREVVKKKLIFYGQADRKGGVNPPWPDRSICEKFNTLFLWNMIP